MTEISNADKKITDVLNQKSFTISAEVIPPRNGAEQVKILKQIESLIEAGAQFLSVTKGAGGSLRGGSLPIAHAIKEHFRVPAIAHFTCRDITPQEVENQMMDHHYFGVRNILALRGDPPMGQPDWQPHENSHKYAYELIGQLVKLNQGEYLDRPDGPKNLEKTKTDFCIGCAVYPEDPEPQNIDYLKRKIDAGAEYAISQMLFDAEKYSRYLDLCHQAGINAPILPGTRVLKSRQQAERMAERFSVSVPTEMMDCLPDKDDPDGAEKSLEVFLKYLEKLKGYGAPGVHLFVLSDTKISGDLIRRLL